MYTFYIFDVYYTIITMLLSFETILVIIGEFMVMFSAKTVDNLLSVVKFSIQTSVKPRRKQPQTLGKGCNANLRLTQLLRNANLRNFRLFRRYMIWRNNINDELCVRNSIQALFNSPPTGITVCDLGGAARRGGDCDSPTRNGLVPNPRSW